MAIRFPNRNARDNSELDTSAYAAPRTEIVQLTEVGQDYNDSKFYSWNGRIGRVQFFAYPVMFMCAAMVIFMLAFMAMGGAASIANGGISESMTGTLGLLMLPLIAASTYIQLAATKRRFNDLNKPGWFMILMFVPVVSLLTSLYLMFMRGDSGINDYGLPPPPPNKATIIAALVIPLFVFLGFGAAIALPAYQDYVTRQQAQQESESTVVTTKTEKVTVASGVAAEAVASSASAEPLPSPEAQVAAAMANQANNPPPVQTQEPTATQANESSPAAVATDNSSDAAGDKNQQAVKQSAPSDVNFANDPSGGSEPSNSSKQSMSYEEFIKTSESQVFTDR